MRDESASALDELVKAHGLESHIQRLQQRLVRARKKWSTLLQLDNSAVIQL